MSAWLLSIDYTGVPGGVLRIATSAVDVDGRVFREGLGRIVVHEELPQMQSIGAMARVAVSWWSHDVDVALLESQGHTLARAVAELAQWDEGMSWEARRVLVRGRLVEATFGFVGETVSAAIEPDTLPERVIPDPSWLGNYATGVPMPIAFGYPGTYTADDGEVTRVAGVGLAGYVLSYGAVEAAQAYVWEQGTDPSTGTAEDVFLGLDISGRPYSSVPSAPAVDAWAALTSGRGIEGVRSLASVLRVLHRIAGVPVDAGSLGAVAQRLGAWMLDGVIDDPADLMTWVGSVLLPLVPLVAVPGRDGWRYIVVRPDASTAEAVYTIDADAQPDVTWAEPVELDDEIRGDLSLGWAWDLATGEPAATLAREGDADAIPWAGKAPCMYDRATVAMALDAIASMWGRRRLLYTYIVPEAGASHVRLGDIVAIEHDALGLSGVAGQVWGLEWGDDGLIGIQVRVWPER